MGRSRLQNHRAPIAVAANANQKSDTEREREREKEREREREKERGFYLHLGPVEEAGHDQP